MKLLTAIFAFALFANLAEFDEFMSGDWDGKGKDTIAVWRNGELYHGSASASKPEE